ncbi:MAG: DUF748 domain-containing protein [Gammaproteobacteria bacterium]
MLQTLRKPILIMLAALVLYALSGFFLLPAVLEAQLPEIVQQETGRKASVGKVSFNPFSLKFSIEDFSIQERNSQPFVSFDILSGNVSVLDSLRYWALVVDEIYLGKPSARIAKNKAGTFNFADLLASPEKPPEQEAAQGIFPFLIRDLTIAEGSCVWEDQHLKKPEKETIAPIDLSISELSTLGSDPSSLHLQLKLSSGASLDWTGGAVVHPLGSQGTVKLDRLHLTRIDKLFLHEVVPFRFKDGTASIAAKYEFNASEEGFTLELRDTKIGVDNIQLTGGAQPGIPDVATRTATLTTDLAVDQHGQDTKIAISQGKLAIAGVSVAGTETTPVPGMKFQKLELGLASVIEFGAQGLKYTVDQGKADLTGFALSEHNQAEQLIEIPKVAITGIKADSVGQRISIASLVTENAAIKAWLGASGALNYQTLFAAAHTTSEPSTTVEQDGPKTSWKIRLDKASVKNYQINFTDRSLEKPVVVDLAGLNIELEHLSNEQGAKLPVEFRTRINEGGAIKIAGDGVLSPLSAELAVDINGVALKTAQPYLEKYVRLEIVEGDLSTQGSLSLALAESDQLSLKFQGNAEIANLLTRDKIQNKDFLKWNNLELGKVSIDLQQQAFELEEVVFEQPYGRIIIKKDGTTNIHDILVAQKPEQKDTAAQESAKSTQKPPIISIGTVRVNQGMSDFADYSLILPFITQMNNLNGTMIGLSSAKDATAKLSLTGKVYDLASVEIAGQYQIDSGDSIVKLKFKNMPLPLVTPYMAEFAGYKIEKGQMSLNLDYTINKGRLEARNNLFIDQFTLGDKVENPNAVSLPLNLAIALLKDSEGKINLDLPISGSLDDPEFSVGSLVFKALGNLLKKIVTSPFQAIASLVGGGKDLSLISFNAGSAELDISEKVKLSKLAEALRSRPSLKLDIKGAAYQEQDWPAMRTDALKDQLKKLKAKELKAKGTKIRSEYVELSDDDYKRLLAQLFIEKFPLLAEYSLFGKPKLKAPEAGDFYEIARQKLESIMVPDLQRLENLALQRASTIAKYMIEEGGIADARVFILATDLDPVKEEPGITATLSLDVAS